MIEEYKRGPFLLQASDASVLIELCVSKDPKGVQDDLRNIDGENASPIKPSLSCSENTKMCDRMLDRS